mgnify:CR=1 FL=1
MFEVLESIEKAYSAKDYLICEKAYDFAKEAHKNQKRASGEEYFTHPCAVAQILVDLGLDAQTVAAAFLHDVIEDTPVSEGDIKKEFGFESKSDIVKYGMDKNPQNNQNMNQGFPQGYPQNNRGFPQVQDQGEQLGNNPLGFMNAQRNDEKEDLQREKEDYQRSREQELKQRELDKEIEQLKHEKELQEKRNEIERLKKGKNEKIGFISSCYTFFDQGQCIRCTRLPGSVRIAEMARQPYSTATSVFGMEEKQE